EPCFEGDLAFGMAGDSTILEQREQNEPAQRRLLRAVSPGGRGSGGRSPCWIRNSESVSTSTRPASWIERAEDSAPAAPCYGRSEAITKYPSLDACRSARHTSPLALLQRMAVLSLE